MSQLKFSALTLGNNESIMLPLTTDSCCGKGLSIKDVRTKSRKIDTPRQQNVRTGPTPLVRADTP